MLGFVLISGIGVMLAGLALGDAAGLSGAILYAVHSMLVMTALYLLAGHDARRRRQLFARRARPGSTTARRCLAASALLLAFAVAGLPPGSGLWPKVMLVKAALDAGAGWLAAAILLSGLLTTVAFGRVFLLAFWRTEPPKRGAAAAQGPRARSSPIAALAALLLALAGDRALSRAVHRGGEERGGRAARPVALCRRRLSRGQRHEELASASSC